MALEEKLKRLTRLGRIFYISDEEEDIVDAVMSKGEKLPGWAREMFESADYDVVGGVIVERHEILSYDNTPERLRISHILYRHPYLNKEEAMRYRQLMLDAGFTYAGAIDFIEKHLKKDKDKTLRWLEKMAKEMKSLNPKDDYMGPIDEYESIPPTYGFHKIDTMYKRYEEEKDWLKSQPHMVRRLFTTPKRCETIEQLNKFMKKCYNAERHERKTRYQKVYLSLTKEQKAVFWTFCMIRKKELLKPKYLKSTTKGLLKIIEDANEHNIRQVKAKLYKIQKGIIKVKYPPSKAEWNYIWNIYKQKEHRLKM